MTSSVIHLHIFKTEISPEPMQIFANGKRHFNSCMEFYTLGSKGYFFLIDTRSILPCLQGINNIIMALIGYIEQLDMGVSNR